MRSGRKVLALAVSLLAAMLLACKSGEQGGTTSGTAGESKTESKPETTAKAKKAEAESVTVPAGTALEVRLVQGIDTAKTASGSAFEATLASALVVNGKELAPIGSTVTGKVTHVVSAGRLEKPAELSLVLDSLTPKGGEKVAISTHTWSRKGESHKKRNAEMIGGGAAAGALIGALTGGKKGAAIGAGVGAGGGTGVAAATGKKQIELAPEAKLNFKLSSPVTLTARKPA